MASVGNFVTFFSNGPDTLFLGVSPLSMSLGICIHNVDMYSQYVWYLRGLWDDQA